MNKHFDDSRYYLTRAAEHATLGLSETVAPYVARGRELVGREPDAEPEPSRLESVREGVVDLERTAVDGARDVVGSARGSLSGAESAESVESVDDR